MGRHAPAPTAQQQLEHNRMRSYGQRVIVVDSIEGIEELFHTYHNCREKPKIYHANGGVDFPIDADDDDADGNDEKSDSAQVETQTR